MPLAPGETPHPTDPANDPAVSGRYTESQFLRHLRDVALAGAKVTPQQKRQFNGIIARHFRVFGANNRALPSVDPERPLPPYSIKLKDEGVYPPRQFPQKRQAQSKLDALKKLLDGYVAVGALEGPFPDSELPAYAQGYVVSNNKGKDHLVTALDKVNKYTELDGPSRHSDLEKDMKAATFAHRDMTAFGSVDALEGFLVVPNTDLTARLCAICTPFGNYLPRRMMFGSTHAPEVFHAALKALILEARGDIPDSLLSQSQYVDDMLVGCKSDDPDSWAAFCTFWDRLLTLLWQAGFRLKLPKCHWLQRTGEFCGSIVDGVSMRADRKRHQDVLSMELPPTPGAILRPIGFFNYFRESIDYRTYGPAMDVLLAARSLPVSAYRKAVTDGSSELRRAFDTLKLAVVEQAVQFLPDPGLPVYAIVDACEHWGHGGSLVQFDRLSGVPRLLQYWSSTWKATQAPWNAGRKEAYAQYYAVTRVLPRYVVNSPAVILVSDANNLTSVRREGGNLASADPLIRRWAWRMLGYPHYFNFVQRTSGAANFLGDVPSRQSESRKPPDVRAAILAELAAAPTIAAYQTPASVASAPHRAPSVRAVRAARAEPSLSTAVDRLARVLRHRAAVPAADVQAPSDSPVTGHKPAHSLVVEIIHAQREPATVAAISAAMDEESRNGHPDSSKRLWSWRGTDRAGIGPMAFYRDRLYVPESTRDAVMKLAHDAQNHPGRDALDHFLQYDLRVCWPHLVRDVTRYISSCLPCQADKTRVTGNPRDAGGSQPTTPPFPNHTWQLDTFGPFEGWIYFVVVDAFTHYVWLIARRARTAESAVEALEMIHRGAGGMPLVLRVDGVRELSGNALKEFCLKHRCEVDVSPPHAPWTLGLAESKVKFFKQLERTCTDDGLRGLALAGASMAEMQSRWDNYATLYNYTRCRTIGVVAPAEAYHGLCKPSPVVLESEVERYFPRQPGWPADVKSFANQLAAFQMAINFRCSSHQLANASYIESLADPATIAQTFQVGTFVLWRGDMRLSLESTRSVWRGPFRVCHVYPGSRPWVKICRLERFSLPESE